MQHKVKVEVAKAKQRVFNDMYVRLDSEEGETDLYRLVRQRQRGAGVIKDKDGNELTGARSVTGRWKEYFEELMNEEKSGVGRVEEVTDKSYCDLSI